MSRSYGNETAPEDVSVKTQRLQLKCDEKQQEGFRWKTDVFVYCHSDLVLLLDLAVRSHNRQVKLDATVFLKYQLWVAIWIPSGRPALFKQAYIKRERARDLCLLSRSLFKNQVTTMAVDVQFCNCDVITVILSSEPIRAAVWNYRPECFMMLHGARCGNCTILLFFSFPPWNRDHEKGPDATQGLIIGLNKWVC